MIKIIIGGCFEITLGDKLYKAVPIDLNQAGIDATLDSIYWTDNLNDLISRNKTQLTNDFGLPYEAVGGYRIIEIEITEPVTVYQSTIARLDITDASGNKYIRPGGAQQTLLLNKDAASAPKITGQIVR